MHQLSHDRTDWLLSTVGIMCRHIYLMDVAYLSATAIRVSGWPCGGNRVSLGDGEAPVTPSLRLIRPRKEQPISSSGIDGELETLGSMESQSPNQGSVWPPTGLQSRDGTYLTPSV